MKSLLILGRIIYTKHQAMQLISDLSEHADNSMEHCMAIHEVEERLVKAGFLDWAECEKAEVMWA